MKPILDQAALHSSFRDTVLAISQATEASLASVVFQLITVFASMLGRGPFWYTPPSIFQRLNLFMLLVGPSGSGRKGTSLEVVRVLLSGNSEEIRSIERCGASSGEGVLHHVRDPRESLTENDPGDPGAAEKRLLLQEAEFSSVLKVASRPGNTLTAILRQAFDGSQMATLTKNSPCIATDHYISMVGHISVRELKALLTEVDLANGFANRFLYVYSERERVLPHGGRFDKAIASEFSCRMQRAIELGKTESEIGFTPSAYDLWTEAYPELTRARHGIKGVLLERSAPIARRLASILALMDLKSQVAEDHLQAALALVKYSSDSVSHIFGDRTGNSLADKILGLLNENQSLSRTQLQELLKRNYPALDVDEAIAILVESRLAFRTGPGQKILTRFNPDAGNGTNLTNSHQSIPNSGVET